MSGHRRGGKGRGRPAGRSPMQTRPGGGALELTQSANLDMKSFTCPPGEHQIQTPWSIYYFAANQPKKPKTSANTDIRGYLNDLNYVGTFSSVEGFWRHYAWLQAPSDLDATARYNMYVFRANLQPAWETFPHGGCWIIKVDTRNNLINHLWERLLFNVIGENFWTPELVGVALQRREGKDSITIWNRDNTQPETRYTIGERLKDLLNLDPSTMVEYKFFRDAITEKSTTKNAHKFVYTAVSQN